MPPPPDRIESVRATVQYGKRKGVCVAVPALRFVSHSTASQPIIIYDVINLRYAEFMIDIFSVKVGLIHDLISCASLISVVRPQYDNQRHAMRLLWHRTSYSRTALGPFYPIISHISLLLFGLRQNKYSYYIWFDVI